MLPSNIIKFVAASISFLLVWQNLNPFKRREPRNPMRNYIFAFVLIIGLVVFSATGCDGKVDDNFPTATPTATATSTPEPTDIPTSTPEPTLTPTLVPTATLLPTPTLIPMDGICLQIVKNYHQYIRELDLEAAWNLLTPQLQKQVGDGTFEDFESFWSEHYMEGVVFGLSMEGCRISILTSIYERDSNPNKPPVEVYIINYTVDKSTEMITGATRQ